MPDLSGRVWGNMRPMRAQPIALCLLATPALVDVAGVASVIEANAVTSTTGNIPHRNASGEPALSEIRVVGYP